MRRSARSERPLFTLAIFLCGLVVLGLGCGGGGGGDGSAETKVFGVATLSRPLVGAEVSILDDQGRALADAVHTDARGTFAIDVDSLPSRFRVEVRGGSCAGTPYAETLRQDVDGFDPKTNVLWVDAVTTLASLHRDRHPEKSVQTTRDEVHRFLGVPQDAAGDCDLAPHPESAFSHEELLGAIAPDMELPCPSLPNGHFAAHLSGFLDELDAGVDTHTFRKAEVGGVADELGELAAKLAEGIASEGASEIFGFIFSEIISGLGLNEEVNLLNEVLGELKMIEHELDELKAEVQEAKFQEVLDGIQPLVSDTKDKFCLLSKKAQFYAHNPCLATVNPPETPAPSCDAEIAEAVDQIFANHARLQTLNDFIAGQGTDFGLLSDFDGLLKATKSRRFYNEGNDPKLVSTFQFYQAIQLMWTTLYIEAVNVKVAQPQAKTDAQDYLNLYTGFITNQNNFMMTNLHAPAGTIIDLNSNLMWARNVDSNVNERVDMRSFFTENPQSDLVDFGKMWCKDHVSAGGFSDWRLPTLAEFQDLLKGREGNSNFEWFEMQGFTGFDHQVHAGGRSIPYYSSDRWNNISSFTYVLEEVNSEDPVGTDWVCRWPGYTDAYESSYCIWYEAGRTPAAHGYWCVRDQATTPTGAE